MAKKVTLYGGPMQGNVVVLPDDVRHFHIARLTPEDGLRLLTDLALDSMETRPQQLGTYSTIHNSPTEFEWDGWKDYVV